MVAAAAAAIIEGYASDAQERVGSSVLDLTLAVVSVLVTIVGAIGYARSNRIERTASQGHEHNGEPGSDR
ncbi:hypothetical protein Slu03_12240 [Sediminihabitans luteus]|nr:hypothetical protein Slu03_12240 [Sediminihabitans luteus]